MNWVRRLAGRSAAIEPQTTSGSTSEAWPGDRTPDDDDAAARGPLRRLKRTGNTGMTGMKARRKTKAVVQLPCTVRSFCSVGISASQVLENCWLWIWA